MFMEIVEQKDLFNEMMKDEKTFDLVCNVANSLKKTVDSDEEGKSAVYVGPFHILFEMIKIGKVTPTRKLDGVIQRKDKYTDFSLFCFDLADVEEIDNLAKFTAFAMTSIPVSEIQKIFTKYPGGQHEGEAKSFILIGCYIKFIIEMQEEGFIKINEEKFYGPK